MNTKPAATSHMSADEGSAVKFILKGEETRGDTNSFHQTHQRILSSSVLPMATHERYPTRSVPAAEHSHLHAKIVVPPVLLGEAREVLCIGADGRSRARSPIVAVEVVCTAPFSSRRAAVAVGVAVAESIDAYPSARPQRNGHREHAGGWNS